MRRFTGLIMSAVLLGSIVLCGSDCLPVPTIEEKLVELAVGGSVTHQFHAYGQFNLNPQDPIVTFDLADSLDLAQIIADAGINVDDLEDIALAGAAYRVIVPDPTPDRRIENGLVEIERSASRDTLASVFSIDVNSVLDFETAPLDPGGVAIVDGVLDDMLAAIKDPGYMPPSTVVSFYVDGTSVPTEVTTDFWWELRLIFTIVGVIRVDMIDF